MAAPKIYLDEDVHAAIAAALRPRTCGPDDLGSWQPWSRRRRQLRFAAAEGYALLAYNIRDFARLHSDWVRSGTMHAGVILARQSEGTLNVRPLLKLLSQVSAEELKGQLVYLANWK